MVLTPFYVPDEEKEAKRIFVKCTDFSPRFHLLKNINLVSNHTPALDVKL